MPFAFGKEHLLTIRFFCANLVIPFLKWLSWS